MALVDDARTKALAPANFQLHAATQDDFRRELTSCLVLCAPSGMSGEDRKEWLRVAWATLADIPADLLAIGCAAARKSADHPAKIVPAVTAAIGALWDQRKGRRNRAAAGWDKRASEPAAVEYATPEQIEAIKAEVGLVTTPYGEPAKVATGPARKPTRADYIEMGVDPAVLDQIASESG